MTTFPKKLEVKFSATIKFMIKNILGVNFKICKGCVQV